MGEGRGAGLNCRASPSIVGWLIEKGKWGHCLPAKRFILCWLSLVPGAWTHWGPHLLLCSDKAGVLQPLPHTPPSHCPGCPECVNPAIPICPATCLLVFKYLPATSPLLESSQELSPPTCLQRPTQSSPRVPENDHVSFLLIAWDKKGKAYAL